MAKVFGGVIRLLWIFPEIRLFVPALWSYLTSIWSITWADEVDFSRQQAKDRMSGDGAISAE